ncbi:hypothetical protein M408DRAFT_24573 [Serendipita vermifera MAFF 305830]|uniref:Uncharacterized protein n=1 Tax=Serendipita vermifera MAFF 305830 TaxID=933852 RepID=A0A0C3B574_SERVB|nr:hypothetical protein M408DRAFT_24573 [Serendipita vermifera MAFF 305830]
MNGNAPLGWLGEATIAILEACPSRTFAARMAFFERSIPEDGLVGWLVSLDTSSSSHTPIPLPFLPLDSASIPIPETRDDVDRQLPDIPQDPSGRSPLDSLENTGCPPQCPITQSILSPDAPQPRFTPFHPFPNTTRLAPV